MKERPAIVAQKLLNLYRQAHVIWGGWESVNNVFISESDDSVVYELEKLPCGGILALHIKNLRTGKTPMDSIDPDLLPYAGALHVTVDAVGKFTDDEIKELTYALENFKPTEDSLNDILELNAVKKFGEEWLFGVANSLTPFEDLSSKWKDVQRTFRAYGLWNVAKTILSNPITERERARVQSDLLEYETYLPMFGDNGQNLLIELRKAVSMKI